MQFWSMPIQQLEQMGNVPATYCDTISNHQQEARLPTACTSDCTTLFRDKRAPESALANCRVSRPCSMNLQQHTQGPLALAQTVGITVGSMILVVKMNACGLAMLVGLARSDTKAAVQQNCQGHQTKGKMQQNAYQGKALGRWISQGASNTRE